MKVDLRPLSRKVGEQIHFQFKDVPVSDRIHQEAPWLTNISEVSGRVENQGEKYFLNGNISYHVDDACDRCLVEISENESIPFAEPITIDEVNGNPSEEMQINAGCIDLSDLVEDYILLANPSQRLCKENCLGLCPLCGCDLNVKQCSCSSEEYNPKFEKLAALKDRLF